jgi:methylenetetrahydrofolate reductase (NADPH)
MPLSDYYRPGKFGLSFELFPPKTPAGEVALYRNLEQLLAFEPQYITCTYGAGGSTRDKTLDIVRHVKNTYRVPVASHLTCVGSSVAQLREYLQEAADAGVDFIMALRGDPPRGESEFCPAPDGLRYANELVALIRSDYPQFGIAVAGYPEKHLEAPSLDVDLANLKRKVETGADIVVTQLFYDNDDFFRFRDRCEKLGIRVPIVPGVLPVTSLSQVQRITTMCGAKLPESLLGALEQADDPERQFQAGVDCAIRQVQGLVQAGVPGIHFYVLNRSQATSRVMEVVDLQQGSACGC